MGNTTSTAPGSTAPAASPRDVVDHDILPPAPQDQSVAQQILSFLSPFDFDEDDAAAATQPTTTAFQQRREANRRARQTSEGRHRRAQMLLLSQVNDFRDMLTDEQLVAISNGEFATTGRTTTAPAAPLGEQEDEAGDEAATVGEDDGGGDEGNSTTADVAGEPTATTTSIGAPRTSSPPGAAVNEDPAEARTQGRRDSQCPRHEELYRDPGGQEDAEIRGAVGRSSSSATFSTAAAAGGGAAAASTSSPPTRTRSEDGTPAAASTSDGADHPARNQSGSAASSTGGAVSATSGAASAPSAAASSGRPSTSVTSTSAVEQASSSSSSTRMEENAAGEDQPSVTLPVEEQGARGSGEIFSTSQHSAVPLPGTTTRSDDAATGGGVLNNTRTSSTASSSTSNITRSQQQASVGSRRRLLSERLLDATKVQAPKMEKLAVEVNQVHLRPDSLRLKDGIRTIPAQDHVFHPGAADRTLSFRFDCSSETGCTALVFYPVELGGGEGVEEVPKVGPANGGSSWSSTTSSKINDGLACASFSYTGPRGCDIPATVLLAGMFLKPLQPLKSPAKISCPGVRDESSQPLDVLVVLLPGFLYEEEEDESTSVVDLLHDSADQAEHPATTAAKQEFSKNFILPCSRGGTVGLPVHLRGAVDHGQGSNSDSTRWTSPSRTFLETTTQMTLVPSSSTSWHPVEKFQLQRTCLNDEKNLRWPDLLLSRPRDFLCAAVEEDRWAGRPGGAPSGPSFIKNNKTTSTSTSSSSRAVHLLSAAQRTKPAFFYESTFFRIFVSTIEDTTAEKNGMKNTSGFLSKLKHTVKTQKLHVGTEAYSLRDLYGAPELPQEEGAGPTSSSFQAIIAGAAADERTSSRAAPTLAGSSSSADEEQMLQNNNGGGPGPALEDNRPSSPSAVVPAGVAVSSSKGSSLPAEPLINHTSSTAETMEDFEASAQQACIICLSDRRNVVVLPCRHMCLCEHCAKKLSQVRSTSNGGRPQSSIKCPLCREKVSSFLAVVCEEAKSVRC
ncbi:unnamed protein product [Amoebophrya sp. A120]|nr:unnamed protein product [Amoebophrya sp. A120]|eukprot:GSA120T00023808001.1